MKNCYTYIDLIGERKGLGLCAWPLIASKIGSEGVDTTPPKLGGNNSELWRETLDRGVGRMACTRRNLYKTGGVREDYAGPWVYAELPQIVPGEISHGLHRKGGMGV